VLLSHFAPRGPSFAALDALRQEPLLADPRAERQRDCSEGVPTPWRLELPSYFAPRGPSFAMLDAFGEEPLLADPPAGRQDEPALPAEELLLALEPVVDLVGHDRRQFWDPSAANQQRDCSVALRAVCPYARADSCLLIYSCSHLEAAC
jgi:hypothetical protein